MKPLIIKPSPYRAGFYQLYCVPRDLEPVLREIVGAKKGGGLWVVPHDMVERIGGPGKPLFDGIHRRDAFYTLDGLPDANRNLYNYQAKGVYAAVKKKRLLINFKPGLGKTPTAIETMRLAGTRFALVICPAIVRDTWKAELETWWPSSPLPWVAETSEVLQSILKGVGETEGGLTKEYPFVITSYELAERNATLLAAQKWDAIILDESHYVKNGNSKRSKALATILENHQGLRLFLTGTPIANEPIDLHNQVDLLYPGLWGSLHEFKRRYCLEKENPHATSGKEYYGINPETAPELRERLSYLSVTATEKEIEGLLPPITFQAVRVRPSRSFDLRSYLDTFDRRDVHLAKSEDAIRACGLEKTGKVVELVEEALASGSTHISVMTHQRATAEEIAAALSGTGLPIACITGADTHKKRHAEIARLAAEPAAIFVGTMHSIGIGINELVAFPDVIYAELDYRPDEVVQSMKRYHRVSGKANVRVRVLVLEGTLEERVARAVSRKLKDQDKVVSSGVLAGDLVDTLDEKISDDEFYKRLQEAAAKMGEQDVYGG